MLTLSGSLRIFLALEPCDMRKSFDGLHTLVVTRLGDDPRGGAVFVFINRMHTILKLLHWDGTGLWVHAKKLQRGRVLKCADSSVTYIPVYAAYAPPASSFLRPFIERLQGGWVMIHSKI